jgi:hypothetical protein
MSEISWPALPSAALSEKLGKKSAFAAPILALAATSNCSALCTSGRRSSNADGKPAGTVGG